MWQASPSFWKRRRVWVIGATSGIGRAIAESICRTGACVLASGRSEDRLADVCSAVGGGIVPLPFDVTSPGDWSRAEGALSGGIDVLIYSAGSWTPTYVQAWDYMTLENQIQVNFLGMARSVGLVLPGMLERDNGIIVGLSSASGYVPLPRAEAYGASKAAALYFLESLRVDLRSSGVRVVSVCPGFVDTPLTAENEFAMPFMTTTSAAAEAIVGGIERGSSEIHFPRRLTVPLRLIGSLPRPMREWVIGTTLKRNKDG